MIKRFLQVCVLFFIMPSTGYALVDMKNANFADTWVDLIMPGSGYDLKVQRTYNSRTLFDGIFGFGRKEGVALLPGTRRDPGRP